MVKLEASAASPAERLRAAFVAEDRTDNGAGAERVRIRALSLSADAGDNVVRAMSLLAMAMERSLRDRIMALSPVVAFGSLFAFPCLFRRDRIRALSFFARPPVTPPRGKAGVGLWRPSGSRSGGWAESAYF